jgi:hypothetical protein
MKEETAREFRKFTDDKTMIYVDLARAVFKRQGLSYFR